MKQEILTERKLKNSQIRENLNNTILNNQQIKKKAQVKLGNTLRIMKTKTQHTITYSESSTKWRIYSCKMHAFKKKISINNITVQFKELKRASRRKERLKVRMEINKSESRKITEKNQ